MRQAVHPVFPMLPLIPSPPKLVGSWVRLGCESADQRQLSPPTQNGLVLRAHGSAAGLHREANLLRVGWGLPDPDC